MPLGAHMSTSGGVEKALLRGQSIGCESIQIFTTNPNQWKSRSLDSADIARFEAARDDTGIAPVVAHARYLINLASPDDDLWAKSMAALRDELELCAALGLPAIVLHPGAHMDSGEDVGIQRVASALDVLREEAGDLGVRLLLENTAGQGTMIGYAFEQLAEIMEATRDASWLGVCFDTCHAFAAGYELRTEVGYAQTWEQFARDLGMEQLGCVHLNDSKGCLGCHLDRHEHIGEGQLGVDAFAMIMNDSAFRGLPLLLETPKGPDMEEDIRNLALLRGLIRTGGNS